MGDKRGYPPPRISRSTPALLKAECAPVTWHPCSNGPWAIRSSRFTGLGKVLGSVRAAGSGTTLREPLTYTGTQTVTVAGTGLRDHVFPHPPGPSQPLEEGSRTYTNGHDMKTPTCHLRCPEGGLALGGVQCECTRSVLGPLPPTPHPPGPREAGDDAAPVL